MAAQDPVGARRRGGATDGGAPPSHGPCPRRGRRVRPRSGPATGRPAALPGQGGTPPSWGGGAWHAWKRREGQRGRQQRDFHPRGPRADHGEPSHGLVGEIEDPLARVGPPIGELDSDHISMGKGGDDRLRAEGRRPMRRRALRPIRACPAGGRSPLPVPTVPGRHADVSPGGGRGGVPAAARGGPSAPGPARARETAGPPKTRRRRARSP